ncbi:MAG: hypothetical protein Q7K55_09445 [Candidatus Levybacteria bacterium]|nr:hypothetical protein [Candidatus Levybacteria bacterium]
MMPDIQTFSECFGLNKNQFELDFVDIPVNNGDIPLFIDPYAISKRNDYWSVDCHNAIVEFFQGVIDQIRRNNATTAKYMLSGLREPNQTRFGLSKGSHPNGRGIGPEQSVDLYDALADSTAVRTGFIKDLEECELLIEGISRDKISDITTNVIRNKLIEYTQAQCELWNIETHSVASGSIWDSQANKWINNYTNLPVCDDRSVILVPKAIARFDMEFDHQEYYQHFVLNFLQSEHLDANSSLIRTLKDGTKKPPFKKILKELNPLSKRYLYDFSKDHPDVLDRYKSSKNYMLKEIRVEDLLALLASLKSSAEQQNFDFQTLIDGLDLIPAGDLNAKKFHEHTIGVLTAIFYPFLINPKKEKEIHEGRKRIDLVFQNSAHDGFFFELPNNKSIPSGYIFIECKNYSSDPANPEIDQLSGRFSTNRGKFGFLVCRNFTNKQLFIQRCRDTADDGRGFIIVLDDSDIKLLLNFRKANDIRGINNFLDTRFQELIM